MWARVLGVRTRCTSGVPEMIPTAPVHPPFWGIQAPWKVRVEAGQ
jgi:hypothetical protein